VEVELDEGFLVRQPLTVELRRADGQVVYRGGVPASGRVQAKLLLPKADEAISLHVTGRRGLDETHEIPVDGASVAAQIQ